MQAITTALPRLTKAYLPKSLHMLTPGEQFSASSESGHPSSAHTSPVVEVSCKASPRSPINQAVSEAKGRRGAVSQGQPSPHRITPLHAFTATSSSNSYPQNSLSSPAKSHVAPSDHCLVTPQGSTTESTDAFSTSKQKSLYPAGSAVH